jgi:hypothetical protein
MAEVVPVEVLIPHPLHRTEITDLAREVFVEFMTEQKDLNSQMRDIYGSRLESVFKLQIGKRIIDVTDVDANVRIRQKPWVLCFWILRIGATAPCAA